MIEQRTPEWFEQRLGKATASRMADICATTKSGWGASRANYRAQLVVERLTGTRQESYTNAAMQWGTDTEPMARDAYSFFRDVDVAETGFVDHPAIAMAGASPDGLILDDAAVAGLVEIKCPISATHIDILKTQTIPDKYIKQMDWQMACVGGDWCDFVSFDPRLPEEMQLFVKRIDRDNERIAKLEGMVSEFLAEVAADVQALNNLYRKV